MTQLLPLKELLPDFYDGVVEMQHLVAVEQPTMDALSELMNRYQTNQFAAIADEDGLSVFEDLLGITGVENEDLETRRYNVLMELLPPQPLTEPYLREVLRLLNINATLDVDGDKFQADVSASVTDRGSSQRLEVLLNRYLPVNLIYTHRVNPDAAPLYVAIALGPHRGVLSITTEV
ncbi:putative phage tail protein [Lacticaseibacillus hulanensis]|uniref:putative phage tail protein n=1 Tax=Lacticaseibacillus hulanensis TaxID=2493111 RepID=UPI000FDB5861|nr:putative phage tail protein [Lacticaseibacillus hulanensis]